MYRLGSSCPSPGKARLRALERAVRGMNFDRLKHNINQRKCRWIALHFLLESVRDNQSKPSYRPSPVVAQADWMNHWRWRKLLRPNFSLTSAAAMEFGKSCLLAKT